MFDGQTSGDIFINHIIHMRKKTFGEKVLKEMALQLRRIEQKEMRRRVKMGIKRAKLERERLLKKNLPHEHK